MSWLILKIRPNFRVQKVVAKRHLFSQHRLPWLLFLGGRGSREGNLVYDAHAKSVESVGFSRQCVKHPGTLSGGRSDSGHSGHWIRVFKIKEGEVGGVWVDLLICFGGWHQSSAVFFFVPSKFSLKTRPQGHQKLQRTIEIC